MKYQFDRHEPYGDKHLFVLALDRKKMKERILVGSDLEVRARLDGNPDAEVLCDRSRPLGTFLINLGHDPDGQWNLRGLMPLNEALHSNRWKQPELEKSAADFLTAEALTGDPAKLYAAYRIWNGYLIAREYRDREAACDRFTREISHLLLAFRLESAMFYDRESGKAERFQADTLYYGRTPEADTCLTLWFPDSQRTSECAVAYESFLPLVTYYLNRLNDWGLCFRQCKVCGKYFLAKSQRYELCSDKCRKAQALQNKREYDERARENNYDLLYKNECQNWRNKINKAKKTPGFPEDRLAKMQAAFEDFKEEALHRKTAVKKRTASPDEFTDWLYQQSNVIIELATAKPDPL
ncbi:MAG: DUF6076 domain-containing protein [Clostridiales bacterium]|nr:DUF6076 domain-containing protein [Clostridiales bacterium]